MKNSFKGLLALTLALAITVSCFCAAAFADNALPTTRSADVKAQSYTQGYDAMVDTFKVVRADCGRKYAYYSPVIDENDTTRYPLVIYIHGRFHGWTDKSFRKSGLTYWCSSEMQNLFEEGGAHLLMPKLSEFTLSSTQANGVYDVITEYMQKNADSIDPNRVLIMGGSAGGGVTWKLLINHPETFAAGVVLCSTKAPSASEIQRVANTPIWQISAKTDPLINYAVNQTPTWNKICQYSNVKDQCRRTVFSNHVTLPDGSHPGISHFLAKTIGYNLCLFSGSVLPGCTTVDANGNNVTISFDNSLVQWFSAVTEETKLYGKENADQSAEAEADSQAAVKPQAEPTLEALEEPATESTAEAPAEQVIETEAVASEATDETVAAAA